jgi:hypothetical protein
VGARGSGRVGWPLRQGGKGKGGWVQVDHIIRSVDTTGSGTIGRDDFLGFIRRGGRPAPSPQGAQAPGSRWTQSLLPSRAPSRALAAAPAAPAPRSRLAEPVDSRERQGENRSPHRDPAASPETTAPLPQSTWGQTGPSSPDPILRDDNEEAPSRSAYDEEWAACRVSHPLL